MQSAPVSPPPITTTCLPSAVSWCGNLVAGDRAIRLDEVVHREAHAEQIPARDGEVARDGRAGRDDDRVVALAEVGPGDVDADVHPGAEAGALGLHLAQALVEVALLHLEVGDAVAQQAADPVVALERPPRCARHA